MQGLINFYAFITGHHRIIDVSLTFIILFILIYIKIMI